MSFREVIVSSPAEPPAVLAWPYPRPPDSVSLFDLDAGEGYAAALAVIGRCDTVVPTSGTVLLQAAPNSVAPEAWSQERGPKAWSQERGLKSVTL